ncbi:MAG: Hsp20/alpha crystallin family protein [Halolamina sp.]
MTPSQTHVDREERFVRRYEREDRWVVAADLPVEGEALDVDTVGDTAIVVMDHGDRVQEVELSLPGAATTVETNNGVLTVEVPK